MAEFNPQEFYANKRPRGELSIWITGMGLALGVIMIVFLLGLILVRGLEVFWPKDVVEARLVEDAEIPVAARTNTLAGEIWKRQTKLQPSQETTESDAELTVTVKEPQEEVQFYLGNRHVYASPFIFVDSAQIRETSKPEEYVVAELDHGPAIFRPQRLENVQEAAGGTVLASERKEFKKHLKRLIKIGQRQKKELEEINRREIGGVNREIRRLRFELEQERKEGNTAAADRLQKEINQLQADYDDAVKKAADLREQQISAQIVYKLATGQEMTRPVLDLRHFYYPNELGFFGKLGVFLHNFWVFISEDPREANQEGGIFPAIFGTFVMTVLMSIAVTPFGVVAAIYLREYAKEGALVKAVRISVNNLAGVPSIVFGMFGLAFFVYLVGGQIDQLFFKTQLEQGQPVYGTGGILWASLTLALLTLPVVIVATEDGLVAVPRGTREAALACGASKWQMIQRVVLPGAAPGILTGLILAMARGAGEVAPLMLVGVVKIAQSLPIDGEAPYIHPERKFLHLGFHIFDLGFQSPDAEAAKPMVFATTFLLIALVVVLNLGAIMIRNHLRKKYTTGAF